jgi:hypothetical protein
LNINPLIFTRIGIATVYGKPYYRFSKSLNDLDLHYDSILPEQIESYTGNLIFTTRSEAPKNSKTPMIFEEAFGQHPTILRGLILQKLNMYFEEEKLILGVDPGSRIGFSAYYYNREIESSFYSSVDDLVSHIITILAELRAKKKIVKIGNGNMRLAKKIAEQLNLKFCSSFELEFVDERRTSLKIKNYNQRGKRDKLSAKYITQREGYRKLILPLSITG